jgi:hypothetical protein
MTLTREALLVALAIAGVGLCAPAAAGNTGSAGPPAVVAQASPTGPLLSGTPEPTEEPTTPPAEALVAAASVGPEWLAFAKIAESATSFITTQATHQSLGDVQFTSTFKITSRKPNLARCDIVAGDGIGAAVLWRGGTKVQAHEGGEHSAIIVVLPRHNKHVTDLVGFACGDTTPDNVVGYVTHNGKLTEAPGPTIDGQDTDDVTWIVNPGDQIHTTKTDFFISKTTHLIIATTSYAGDAVVEHTTWNIQVQDPPVPYSVFDFGA